MSEKKGKPVWQPAELLTVHNKEPGFRYRWQPKDAAIQVKAQAEGWEPVNAVTSTATREDNGERVGVDGKAMTTLTEYRELMLMRMPEEIAEARNAYYREKSESPMERAQGAAHDRFNQVPDAGRYGAKLRGSFTIE